MATVSTLANKTSGILSSKGLEYGAAVAGGLLVGIFDPLKYFIFKEDANLRAFVYIVAGAGVMALNKGAVTNVIGGSLMACGIIVLANKYVVPTLAPMLAGIMPK